MRYALAVACLLSFAGCASSPRSSDPHLRELDWLAGEWIGEDGDTITEEQWTLPRGGTMFGINRVVHNGETAFFEYLCIQHTHEGVFYLASPKGRQPPTPFKMVPRFSKKRDEQVAIFENAEHDFPSRIRYERIGNTLHARIEGTQNGQPASEHWVWRRAR